MDINGYVLESVAFMTRSGPLWHTRDEEGRPALVALRPSAVGEEAEGRWQAWARVEDPHVVRLLDVARHRDGRWALVMERVEGRTLETLLAVDGPRDLASRRRIASGVRAGVEALHAVGLVHGDVAPSNVVVRGDGTPVLVDLVDPVDDVVGTPGWSQGGPGGTDGDLDSLGAIERALRVAEETAPGDDGSGAADVLRRVATSASTEVEEVPRRRVRPLVGVAALGVLALVAGLAAAVHPWGRGTTRAEDDCPGQAEVADLVEGLLSERDRAMVAGDAEALEDVLGGDVLGADRRILELLEGEGVRLTVLGTDLERVGEPTCSAGKLEVAATLRQTSLARCDATGRCEEVGPQEAHAVLLRLGGTPWRVTEVLPG